MKKIIITAFVVLLSATIIQAQDEKEKEIKIHLESSEDAKPVVYVDGKLFEFPIELLDADQIESVNVLKGEKAIKEYNAQHRMMYLPILYMAHRAYSDGQYLNMLEHLPYGIQQLDRANLAVPMMR